MTMRAFRVAATAVLAGLALPQASGWAVEEARAGGAGAAGVPGWPAPAITDAEGFADSCRP